MSSLAKTFEKICKNGIEKEAYIYRINDFGNFAGISNPCDFIAYKYPYMYMLEMKTTAGSSIPIKNISEYQYQSMLNATKHKIKSFFIIWYYDKDITIALPVEVLRDIKETNKKSIRYDYNDDRIIKIVGEKEKVYFEYDWKRFFKESKTLSCVRSRSNGKSRGTRGVCVRNRKRIFYKRR